ncbi:protein of unknown function [Pseudomonas sp. JV551A1]|nr:protein of unknown function [Pseudomonas sp. JV551A1]
MGRRGLEFVIAKARIQTWLTCAETLQALDALLLWHSGANGLCTASSGVRHLPEPNAGL